MPGPRPRGWESASQSPMKQWLAPQILILSGYRSHPLSPLAEQPFPNCGFSNKFPATCYEYWTYLCVENVLTMLSCAFLLLWKSFHKKLFSNLFGTIKWERDPATIRNRNQYNVCFKENSSGFLQHIIFIRCHLEGLITPVYRCKEIKNFQANFYTYQPILYIFLFKCNFCLRGDARSSGCFRGNLVGV